MTEASEQSDACARSRRSPCWLRRGTASRVRVDTNGLTAPPRPLATRATRHHLGVVPAAPGGASALKYRHALQGLLQGHGRRARREPGRHQARVPQARPQVPPRRQQGKGRRGEVQGAAGSARGPEGRREARRLRPARRRLASRPGLSAAAGLGQGLRILTPARWRPRRGRGPRRIQRLLLGTVRRSAARSAAVCRAGRARVAASRLRGRTMSRESRSTSRMPTVAARATSSCVHPS